jgi:hypothetical protein
MSATDKTRQQLVDSMRKTKAAAAGKPAARSKASRSASGTAKGEKKPAATAAGKRSAKVEGASRPGMGDSNPIGKRTKIEYDK